MQKCYHWKCEASMRIMLMWFPESIATSEGPDANGLFTEKATLRKTLSRKELGAVFECRIESEALESTVRHQLKVDLQGKPIPIEFLIINIKTECYESRFFSAVRCVHSFFLSFWKIASQLMTIDPFFFFALSVRPRKVEVSGVRQHTVQGSTVSLLCKVIPLWN